MDDPHHNSQEQGRGQGGDQRPNENNDHTPSASYDNDNNNNNNNNTTFQFPKLKHYKWWIRITTYILLVLIGQTAATLLGELYYNNGGNSKWMATFVQSAGFPILIPLLYYFPQHYTSSSSPINNPPLSKLALIYFTLGLILTGDNLMYSYGLLYLPVSTYSLLCATQLAFNAVFAFFINSQKFTILVLNSLVLLTISACLLGINGADDNDGSTINVVSRRKYIIGFLCTLGASATYSLLLSLIQLSFEKVIKQQTFKVVLHMQIYISFVATCGCVVGLFASGEWRSLSGEMRNYKKGSVSYVMTLAWAVITWQLTSVGLLGLVFEVSSLFSNVISTVAVPLIPIFAVVFFHDKMNGIKVIALVLATWGFISYMYQHYLDNTREAKKAMKGNKTPSATIEIC